MSALFSTKNASAVTEESNEPGGLSFLDEETLRSPADSGKSPVVPGDLQSSELIRRVRSKEPDEVMPPAEHGPPLKSSELALLEAWIQSGAAFEKHWSLREPLRPQIPSIKNESWVRQDVDRFILEKLEPLGLSPSKEADRRTWLRRVSFDLIGLPPSADELEKFLNDTNADAFEQVVDRLLKSEKFGERWASYWLDIARYADTSGFERDPTRHMWPWRDWVVDAFNNDLPYDQFLIKQYAGDLLPDNTSSDRLATAFHRNTQTNTECGTDDEEFRNIAVMDRLHTTWEGVLSTTFRCSQCHNHPYDSFSHEDYYRVFSIFNTTQDNDCNEDFPHELIAIESEARENAEQLSKKIESIRETLHEEGTQHAKSCDWVNATPSKAVSTGPTTMSIREVDGVSEITATGNVGLRSVYTLEFPITQSSLTAISIEALPFDSAMSAISSELGFVLSHLKTEIVQDREDGKEQIRPVLFAAAYDDDPTAFYPAEATLEEDLGGWSAYPRMNRARHLVLSLAEQIEVLPNSRLRLTMRQDHQSTGITAQVIRRSRYKISNDPSWLELLKSQAAQRDELKRLLLERLAIPSVPVPVLREQHKSQVRESRVYERGNFLTTGKLASTGVPAVFGNTNINDRLEFAKWMTEPSNPLTSRTAVNRIWEQLFGRGIVETSDDFGTAGKLPTHSELLDWLASRFSTELKWSNKRLLREIVLSATYRQSADWRGEAVKSDPHNLLCWRGPRKRLSAEMVRDQALAVAGLLSTKKGGPPVMPLQPEGIWRTVYNASQWITSPGEDAHRRSLYTFIRRTSGYPSYQIFDAPTREVCSVRRITTNTPLQALVSMNDPVYLEAAGQLARKMLEVRPTIEQQIAFGYERVTNQPASSETLKVLEKLYQSNFDRSSNSQSAMTIVANAILNLDVSFNR
ncbi:MAG: PSD1 and planctomycete cytochrome C domain-containing protein [Pirellulales bacterium]